jgi:putative transposase
MAEYARGSHTVHDIKYHIVWITKYRYKILTKKIAERLRELLIQGCESRGITIVEGSVGKAYVHVHMLISCPTHIAPAKIVQYLKGRSSRLIQDEFPELKKQYWGQHLWARGYFCATVGTVTQEMIREYIEHQFEHGDKKNFKIEDDTTKDEFQS